MRMIEQGRTPTRLGSHGIDRVDMPDGLASLTRRSLVLDKLIPRPGRERRERNKAIETRHVLGVGVEKPCFRIERRVRPVLSASRPRPNPALLSALPPLRYLSFPLPPRL